MGAILIQTTPGRDEQLQLLGFVVVLEEEIFRRAACKSGWELQGCTHILKAVWVRNIAVLSYPCPVSNSQNLIGSPSQIWVKFFGLSWLPYL